MATDNVRSIKPWVRKMDVSSLQYCPSLRISVAFLAPHRSITLNGGPMNGLFSREATGDSNKIEMKAAIINIEIIIQPISFLFPALMAFLSCFSISGKANSDRRESERILAMFINNQSSFFFFIYIFNHLSSAAWVSSNTRMK